MTVPVHGVPAGKGCVSCGMREATVKVTPSGMLCDPVHCDRCHEKHCARDWKMHEWRSL